MFKNPLDYVDLPSIRTNTPNDGPIAKEEIAIVMKKLHKGKAAGPDGIDNIIIKQINKRLNILFMEQFNKCLHLGIFSDPLKYVILSYSKKKVKLRMKPLFIGITLYYQLFENS
ncbi:hypothetical protein AVEN_66916-1 [Araneus ventricosus]|uniref:Reverse transcriptase domain-containing protein n=1 Tax=Araneus ventricosus TaxID=182803 RepID=A0A4Y2SRB1_ARAVE|nr:hypothetical protein AVEN_66916-1 [Araneus ventricosus]